MKESIFSSLKKVKREQWIVCGLAGLLFLVISTPVKKEDAETVPRKEREETKEEITDIRREYEQQLTEALSQVHGVGNVKVFVTMESTGKKIVEKDVPENSDQTSRRDSQGQEQTSFSESSTEATVYEETEQGGHMPYVSSRIYPEIRGVLVVASGGDRPELIQQIQEAVMALFHVDAHKIKVLKMK